MRLVALVEAYRCPRETSGRCPTSASFETATLDEQSVTFHHKYRTAVAATPPGVD
jgi:hypothetical protein